jgi:opacity protein-like surface antigen
MTERHRYLPALALMMSMAMASPLRGQPDIHGYAMFNATLDELVQRHTLGAEAIYFGGQGVLEDGRTSVAPYAFLGFYEYEGIMAGVGASVQTEALLPLGVGAGFGLVDADIKAYAVTVNAQERVDLSTWSTLLLQGAVAYQWKGGDRVDYFALYLKPAVWPESPEDLILVDNLNWYSAYVHAVFEVRWSILKPLLDIGWMATRYRYTGYECGLDCFQIGNGTSGSGSLSGFTVGVGLSLELGALQAFGGIMGSDVGTIFPVSLAIVF